MHRDIISPLIERDEESDDEREREVLRRRREQATMRFRNVIKKVLTLIKVFRCMRMYAIEKGQHVRDVRIVFSENDIKPVTIVGSNNLFFNLDNFKNIKRDRIPNWAYNICNQPPEDRSKMDIENLVVLMQSLKGFRKYYPKEQELLARSVRYESFPRRRVIVRKGHIGTCFYLIYSGSLAVITAVDDDDVPFLMSQNKPSITLQAGDSFGELALVKSTNRSATVVCLERTELFVVDNECFFNLGMDALAKEEIEYRLSHIRSIDVFSRIGDEECRNIAEQCKEMNFLTDKIIEYDSTDTDNVFFVTKGKCIVLRLVDVRKQRKLIEREKNEENHSNVATSRERSTMLPPIFTQQHAYLTSSNIYTNARFDHGSNETTKDISDSNQFEFKRTKSKKLRLKKKPHAKWGEGDSSSMMENSVFLKVDILTTGKSFGLHQVLEDLQEHQLKDDRKFVLVSSGCQVIRIPREVLVSCIPHRKLLKILRSSVARYPSDEELYVEYEKLNTWKRYRESVVSTLKY